MKLPNCLKNLNSRKGNEKGSVTLFVLIAMLFFLMIGMMIFIINMNTETSQKRDVEKIKSEYNANTSETDLEQLYQEAKQRQIGTFMIKLIDKYGTIYNSGEWVNENWLAEGRLPLTVQPNFPEGLKDISVTVKDDTYGGSTIITKTADLATMEIRADKDCQYTIENTLDNTNQVKINIDTTKPTIDELKGGTIWKGTEEEEITGTDAGGAITITARDNLSGVKELKYIINNSPEAPSADAEWTTVEGATAQVTINNENDLGIYYIHAMATDVAGNVRDVVTSGPYEVKQANYKITTTTGTTYSETLKDAAEKPGAMVIKVLNTFTDEVPATIAQNVTIDTNGKTLTMAETITVASGATTTFVDTAETKGKLERTTGDLITNNGNIVVNDLTMSSNNYVINGGNNVTVNSGNLNSSDTAVIIASNITVNNGNIISQGRYGITSRAVCDIKGGKVEGAVMGVCPSNGTLKISGTAEIKGGNNGIGTDAPWHSYTLEMTGGTIIGTAYNGIYSQAQNTNISITRGTITGGRNSIMTEGTNTTVTITGGTITGATEGINITGANSTVTIGDNTNALNKTTPVITGTTGTGINIAGETSTLNYYDGTIIGKTKALASDGKRTYFGREVTFDAPNDTTVNFLTETEANNVIRYYRPYTREKKDNNNVTYYETVLEKQVNVTFNPGEGATVAENNRNVLTNVEYKEKAEDATIVSLPTPEKTGYTFKGWNGKNLFNKDDTPERPDYYITGDGNNYYHVGYSILKISLKPNTIYTITNSGNSFNPGYVVYDSSETRLFGENYSNRKVITFTTPSTASYIKFSVVTQESSANYEKDIFQIEEGTTATPYEPYYIENDTKVVQDQDHTLNAIWEANEYTVHFNGDGSTAGTVEDQKFKYDEEKALNENKFERKYTVTYDGNEGTPAKADDTATYTFANWGNKDILGYDLDFSEASKNTGTKYGKENGYTTISCDATEASSDKNMANWTIQPQFNSGDRYKLTFYAKGNNLTTYFYGASNYLRVSKSESSQGVEHTANNNSTYSDGRIDFALTDEWTKYSVIYTLGSYGDRNVNKYVLFRVMHGNIASIYGVRFEKLENEEHQDKAVVKNLTSEPNGEVTLYAVWTPHEVTLPTATREGYIFNGWYDAATGGNKIGDAGDKYIPEANTTLHAQWRQVHYTILVGEETLPAETLAEAVGLAEERITGSVTTATITATMNYNDNSTANITKNITIDIPAGKTITMANTITVASGATTTFVGTGTVQRNVADGVRGDLITNNGTVVVGVQNSETGPTLTSKDVVIKNGTVKVYSGIIASQGQSATVDNAGIYSGTINVYGGNITNDNGNYGIVVGNNGRCNISGGTVSGKMAICPQNGTLTVSESANIQGRLVGVTTSSDAHKYTLNMTGGTISSIRGRAIQSQTKVNITITGGTITGATEGINITGANSTLTIGDNTNALDRTAPVITGTTGKGISIDSATSTLNYYDGTIIGKEKGTKTFNGREVAFSVKDDTIVNFLTETEAGNVTRYYRPYTREKKDNNNVIYYETVLEKQVNVTFNPGEGATVAESNRNVLTNVEYKEKAEDATIVSLPTPEKTGYTFKTWKTVENLISDSVADWEVGGINIYGEISNTTKRIRTKNYVRVSPNTKYKISTDNSQSLGVRIVDLYDKDYNFVTKVEDVQGSREISFTTGTNVAYILVSLMSIDGTSTGGDISVNDIQNSGIYMKAEVTDTTLVTLENNHTLKAVWEATPYTVTLNAGDGTIDAGDDGWARAGDNKTATKDITYDSNYGTLPTASRTGYTFDGWYTDATNGTQITDVSIMQTASAQSLYAHWTANNYTIHFDANGGTGEMTDLPMTYGTPANLTANAFSRTGYKFVKWTSNADGTGNEYIDGQTVNNLTEINNDTVNLFAQWEERPFVVTFNPNGGIVTPESKEITYNSTYGDLPSGDNIKRLGYTFAGWYKEAELTNEVTAETTYDITEDSTLYAKWTPHVYTVTFNKNGGTGTMSDQSFTYGQTQNLRANTFTRTGYTFAGWARAENGTVEFTNEQSISNLTPENGGTITLYAVWNDVTRPSWSVRLLDIINK